MGQSLRVDHRAIDRYLREMGKTQKNPSPKPTTFRWLECFHCTDSEEKDATFQMVIDGERSADRVVDTCVAPLRELHRSAALFDKGADVFLDHILRLPEQLEAPTLVNYALQIRNDPPVAIYCGVPEQTTNVDTFGRETEQYGETEPLVSFKPRGPRMRRSAVAPITPRRKSRSARVAH